MRTPNPSSLHNFEMAEIPRRKIEGYLLDPFHKEGRNKARVFRSALGYEQRDWDHLAKAIAAELPYWPAVIGSSGEWGEKYEVTLPITGKNNRTVEVLTVWIVRPQVDYPSLVTALVVGKEVTYD